MSRGWFIAHGLGADATGSAERPGGWPRDPRPLMEDIARLAGVSTPTVSRALSGGGRVAADTRARILDIAQSLHYGVDERARSLRLGQNHTVSVVVPKGLHPGGALTDPLRMELLGGIADALAEQGHAMLLARPAQLTPSELARDVETGRARGLVIVGQGDHSGPLAALVRRSVPFVAWGGDGRPQPFASVGPDNLVTGRLVAGHLLDRRARRVVFLGDGSLPETVERHAGYLQAHRARGVPALTEALAPWPDGPADPLDPLDAWLCRQPAVDAVFAASDQLAIGVVHRLRRLGRRVPEDILVAGGDGTALAALCDPPLTSVAPMGAMAGTALVDALQQVLNGRLAAPTLLPCRLQVRQSSAAGLRGARQGRALHG